jgi:exosome complex component RRP42
MAPASNQVLLSPAELSYLHTSLSLHPPIRPDARSPTQFRPLIAETDILPGTNGSARICFADGTEAIVGVKAEVEKSSTRPIGSAQLETGAGATADEDEEDENAAAGRMGENAWVEVTVEIPGFRDDEAMPVFLATLLCEALLADGEFTRKLWINSRFHWRLYIDVCTSITFSL